MTTIAARGDAVVSAEEALYRDIHKGIRTELFGVTMQAGRTDPGDRSARSELAARVDQLVTFLVLHAGHEDAGVQPTLEAELPELAERIERDHLELEASMAELNDRSATAVSARRGDQRQQVHELYLELAGFTSRYLAHQDVEERVVAPALRSVVGSDAMTAMHQAIVASIPPDEMATGLALMIPAMNIDDRTELLGGMQANAPAPVFEGVWGLVGTVLPADDKRDLAERLGIA
ncbi:MAG TPA: hemerythrin domain-containing protein [Acidimicrobiia bacterium]|jgi:hypothetical protein